MEKTTIILAIALIFTCLFAFAITAYAAENTKITDAKCTDIIMNVGADETERNLTWYSNYKTRQTTHQIHKTV